jgi:hypothetical protein
MGFPKFNSAKLPSRQTLIKTLPPGDSLRIRIEGEDTMKDAFKKMKASDIKPVISMKIPTPLISQSVKPALSVLDMAKRDDIVLQKRN